MESRAPPHSSPAPKWSVSAPCYCWRHYSSPSWPLPRRPSHKFWRSTWRAQNPLVRAAAFISPCTSLLFIVRLHPPALEASAEHELARVQTTGWTTTGISLRTSSPTVPTRQTWSPCVCHINSTVVTSLPSCSSHHVPGVLRSSRLHWLLQWQLG